DLHRIFANPTESQLAEITQFFLRQPLRLNLCVCNLLKGAVLHEPRARLVARMFTF
ncbi:hypothetical protein GOB05_24420, partial [Sinorhizobium meliloti]|nr:hypothetical protein [Sinorhizobium meliloti]